MQEPGKYPELVSDNPEKKVTSYLREFYDKWVRWTGIQDDEVVEGLNYLSGDLFFEMRKLTAQVCEQHEKAVGRILREFEPKVSKEELKSIFDVINPEIEKLKEKNREALERSWRSIVDKQKVGVDKICIVITRTCKPNSFTDKKDE